jgi:hypothetical protein
MCNRITLENKLVSLNQRHKQLDENIKRGYTNYMDDAGLSKMKQEKAQVKRQIESINLSLSNPSIDILR